MSYPTDINSQRNNVVIYRLSYIAEWRTLEIVKWRWKHNTHDVMANDGHSRKAKMATGHLSQTKIQKKGKKNYF